MGGLSTTATVIIIIFAVIILLIFYGIGVYNKLVNSRNKVKDQWAQIDVQLKRRADLIPNLVETVKGYAKHEKNTLAEVIEARNKFVSAGSINEEIEANNQLTGALNKLFALSESYPELKANQNFISLQNDLKDTEDKISYARQFYNDTVLTYNNLVQMFPSNIIANMFKFEVYEFFKIEEKEKEVPKVSFE
ncbi:MAG: LemA family protein [Tenericutes bacterium]|nr:LemA family protein [Mycoplasmatota bacterium]